MVDVVTENPLVTVKLLATGVFGLLEEWYPYKRWRVGSPNYGSLSEDYYYICYDCYHVSRNGYEVLVSTLPILSLGNSTITNSTEVGDEVR